ncbi:carboxypeptidase-like regulatory domain-containing protein [Mucilaginibacter sp. UC70_90]
MKIFTNSVRIIVLFLVLLPGIGYAQLNGSYILSGKVNDDQSKPLIGATVSIKGTTNKTSTDTTGKFSLTTSAKLPYTLVFTAIGYQPQEFYIKNANSAVNITLTTQSLLVNEVVVTASVRKKSYFVRP